ncbi:radical SAM enzyme, Cfr family [Desulfosudis oleivorans Hxd3]|uniref:Dual-specificity RNA methyltransferase RlmN n=2 Tax=Desulfosudis TaxID=2904716 RepID=RLMN_DESOH|nr:23S rRNA (adenine(2503)-C(2))-methyltransferase RlmN [Desulfosudis oleivorans]A8ZV25.1 RecName: Full=Dual-specificity RNA methyltransferase RlmN; AltName: Full=23S rRNA (adenine(2503)-C(2))-methyltransferase; AltName: Full=23S rRNA m2A2503 methyltransferase; AltName: Full=Ribosomal RNA large subunit methyltransferase N; AltName: Full=tRNA (adenine(37)-C(2))-methyltransferase; AltName: Full=tRNA m2A37 methyltransferase [Desulfosudis oleivorans Hxd3]ABW68115.1 radical SAM enzyme, Cfr family [Des
MSRNLYYTGPPKFIIKGIMNSTALPQEIQNLTRARFADWLNAHNIAPYRADQVFKWLFVHRAESFDQMTNISKPVRTLLAESFIIGRLKIARTQQSADGTRKYLFELSDGEHIESVLIPEEDHFTLCVSTQVGCAQGCAFCMTAKKGFVRNLTPAEITGQVLGALKTLAPEERLTNIVLMGMGEPLANYDNVITSLDTICDGDCGLQFSTRRVTLSTSGLVPRMAPLGLATTVNLAVSLNATDNKTRDMLMPINKTYPIEVLLEACRTYPLSNRRKITFEYILMAGVNDSEKDALRLVKLLRSIKAKVNLIPFNEHEGAAFKRPDDAAIERFKQILHDRQYTVMTRQSKGADISAACGQLAADIKKYGQNK